MTGPSQAVELFEPYVWIPSGLQGPNAAGGWDPAVRALLADRARMQASALRGRLARRDIDSLPPVLRGLDRETRGGRHRSASRDDRGL
jgi:hypothetical protein